MIKKDTKKQIDKLLSSKKLHIKALTSSGILTGVVIDINNFSSNSNNENSNFLNILLNQISNDMNITVNTNSIVYTIENAKLYPISNLRESIFLNIVELNSSKIIALCHLFEEVD